MYTFFDALLKFFAAHKALVFLSCFVFGQFTGFLFFTKTKIGKKLL